MSKFKKCKDCREKLNDYRTKRCRYHAGIEHSKMMKGKNNPMYINGNCKNDYPMEFTFKLKLSIFKRDKFACKKCNKNKNLYLTAHHIDYNKQNCKKENLITLCQRCNIRVNFNRDYWYAYFRYILEKRHV